MISTSPFRRGNGDDAPDEQNQQTVIGIESLERLRLVSGRRRSYIEHMDDGVSRSEIDAKIAATEARADARFAQILGELRTANAEVLGELRVTNSRMSDLSAEMTIVRSEASSNRNFIIGTVIGTLVTIAIGLFGLAQWSDARMFGIIQMRETIRPALDAGGGPTMKSPESKPQVEPTPPAGSKPPTGG